MARRPRVLVVTPDYPPARGGIQVLLNRLVTNWERVEARVVTLGSSGARDFDGAEPGIVRRAPSLGGGPARIAALNALGLVEAARFRPHVVLSGHIVTSPAARALRALGIPYVQYLYGEEATSRPRLASRAIARASCVVAISAYTESLALELGASPDRVHRISPGVDAPREHPAPDSRPNLVSIVARLEERYKGHDVVLRAFPLIRAEVPDARLAVVGEGRLRPALEGLAEALGIGDAVEFTGEIDGRERDALLARSRVFLMPSRLSAAGGGEGFGIVYLEAAVHGVPSVAGRAGGALDAVVDGETGLLVDPLDHVAVADAVTTLLSDPGRAEALGVAAAERAGALAWPTVARRVEDVLLAVSKGA